MPVDFSLQDTHGVLFWSTDLVFSRSGARGSLVIQRVMAQPGKRFAIVLVSLVLSAFCPAQDASFAGTTTFVFDGNRMYAELDFVRPDGSIHRALAFVDMGSPSLILTESLFKQLQLGQNRPLRFR